MDTFTEEQFQEARRRFLEWDAYWEQQGIWTAMVLPTADINSYRVLKHQGRLELNGYMYTFLPLKEGQDNVVDDPNFPAGLGVDY